MVTNSFADGNQLSKLHYGLGACGSGARNERLESGAAQGRSAFSQVVHRTAIDRGEDRLAEQSIQHVLMQVTGQATDLIETLDWLLMYRQLDACDQLLERFADVSKKEYA